MAEGKDISGKIGRRTLRCVTTQQIKDDTLAVSGEFGVNTFQCITLAIIKFKPYFHVRGAEPTEEEKEFVRLDREAWNFWKAQEGKTFSELKDLITRSGGNFIELRRFKFTELQRFNALIDLYYKGQITEEQIKEAHELEQLRRDSFGIEI